MDSRFIFEDPPNWRGGTRQLLQGSEYDLVKPTKPVEEQPKQVEFELMTNNPILFGNGSRFQIQGTFERKAAPTVPAAGQAAPAAPEWEAVPVDDRAKVILAPNWFELMIQSVDIYHGNGVIRTHDQANFIPSMLNTYLYSRMDPSVKKFLCTEDLAPGYGVPSSSKRWEFASDEWTSYAEKVFTGETITFSWIPLHTFPFFPVPQLSVGPSASKSSAGTQKLGQSYLSHHLQRRPGLHLEKESWGGQHSHLSLQVFGHEFGVGGGPDQSQLGEAALFPCGKEQDSELPGGDQNHEGRDHQQSGLFPQLQV